MVSFPSVYNVREYPAVLEETVVGHGGQDAHPADVLGRAFFDNLKNTVLSLLIFEVKSWGGGHGGTGEEWISCGGV